MTIAFPLTFSTDLVRSVSIRARSLVGISSSPFTFAQQAQVHPGEMWEADIELVSMRRAQAEAIIAQLLALNGREGTLLFGDPLGAIPRGVATGTPLVKGAGQTGKVLVIDGFTPNTAGVVKAGDWLQTGSGASTRLHKFVADADSDATGTIAGDIWPRLRSSPADDATVTLFGAKGIWRLATNTREWSIEGAQRYGLAFSVTEAI